MARGRIEKEDIEDVFDTLFGTSNKEEEGRPTSPQSQSNNDQAEDDFKASLSADSIPKNSIPRISMLQDGIPQDTILTDNIRDNVQVGRYHVRVDQNVFDELLPVLTLPEQVVYLRLYRLSWGFHRNWCEAGYGAIAKKTNLAISTVKKAILSLIDRGLVVVLEVGKGTRGTKYEVKLPQDVMPVTKKTEVVSLSRNSILNISVPNDGIPGETISGDSVVVSDTDNIPGNSIPGNSIPVTNIDNKGLPTSVSGNSIPTKASNTNLHNTNNNKIPDDVVDQLKILGVSQKSIERWIEEYGVDEVCLKLDIYRYIAATREEPIDNPPGWLARALKDDYDYPEDYYKKEAQHIGQEIAKKYRGRG